MADNIILKSLKKITYESLDKFLEDINRNFAVIENSPLYKGIPGEDGGEGKKGAKGERGSKMFFVHIEDFIKKYPGEITNLNAINQVWFNVQLTDLVKTNKLLELFNVSNFVDCDIIVLGNSRLIQYDALSNVFRDTGISFYQQNTLLTSIENKIATLVKQYIDNNPKILSIKNLLVHYETYGKVYSSTSNSYITTEESDATVYFPYFAGTTDNQGVKIINHKYFGISSEEYPLSNNGSLIIGSVERFGELLNSTLSVTERSTFSSDFAPNKNNIPNLIVLQDTAKNGIMLGYKYASNITRFASIYKDYDSDIKNDYTDANREGHNLVLKSDQGINEVDFSMLLINRYRMRYNKEVYFTDNLEVSKDFNLLGNIDNKFIRTAEKIKTKYTSTTNNDEKTIRSKTIEIGANVADSHYLNISRVIELPYFYNSNKTTILTTERAEGKLQKLYYIEEGSFAVNSDQNLDNLAFTHTPSGDNNYSLINTNQLLQLVSKLNNVQTYIKNNYYRIDEFNTTTRLNNTNKTIPVLNVGNIHTINTEFIVYNSNRTKSLFSISSEDNGKIVVNQTTTPIELYPNSIRLFLYDLTSHSLTKNNRQNVQLVTTDDNGNLVTNYYVQNSTTINNLLNVKGSSNWTTNVDDNKTLVTVDTIGVLQNQLISKFKEINNDYWKKSDYHTTSTSSEITVGNIPHIYVKDLLGGKRLIVENNSLNKTTVSLKPTDLFDVASKKIQLDSTNIVLPKHKSQVLVTNASGMLYQAEADIYTIEDFALPTLSNVKDCPTLNITDDSHHILTSTYLKWINNRMNMIVENGLGDEFWKKVDFVGDDKGNFVIPTLNLKTSLGVTGEVNFWNLDKTSKYFEIIDNILCLGHVEDSTTTTNTEVDLRSNKIRLQDTDFGGNVLVTYKNNEDAVTEIDESVEDYDAESVSEGETINAVPHKAGEIRKDITLTTDSGLTQSNDNLVPTASGDKTGFRDDGITPNSKDYKTKDKHKILTGRTLKWLMGFMDAVKKRFANTFNKVETMQHMHDILPVGSIIMWTKTSYELACLKDANFKNKSRNGIPNGWWPCNGSTIAGTSIKAPDMRNKFVRGVDADSDDGLSSATGTGGRNKYKLKEGQLPNLKHTHAMDKDGSHSHLLTTKQSDAAYYTGEFAYRNDISKTETVRQKIGTACDASAAYSESSPVLMPNGQAIKLRNLKVPVVVGQYGLLSKSNWIDEHMQSHWTGGGTEKSFRFDSAITAGINIFDFVYDYLNGNAFEITNIVDGFDVSTHRHSVHQTGLGMSTETKQGYIYTVPEYYNVIYIIKYTNDVTVGEYSPETITVVGNNDPDDGSNYNVPQPDQKEGSTALVEYTINVNIEGSGGTVYIAPDKTTSEKIYSGDSLQIFAIPNTGYRFKKWMQGSNLIAENIIPENDLYGLGTNQRGAVTVTPTASVTYTAIFEKIPDVPAPPAPVEVPATLSVNLTASLDGYSASEIDYIKYITTGQDGDKVTIELRKS